MKQIDRVFVLALAFCLILALSACTRKDDRAASRPSAEQTEPSSGEVRLPVRYDSPEIISSDRPLPDSAEDITQPSLEDSMEDLG